MNRNRLLVICMCAALPILLWLAWPNRSLLPDGASTDDTDLAVNVRRESALSPSDPRTEGASRSQRQRTLRGSGDSVSLQVDRLLASTTLDDEYVVQQLREIAGDSRLKLSVRSEAIDHGLLLDVPPFADLAKESDLPEILAMSLLGRVINSNDDPMMQIEVYVNLMNHSSTEVREEALDMLRFMVEDDFEEADQAQLLSMAELKLKDLASKAEN